MIPRSCTKRIQISTTHFLAPLLCVNSPLYILSEPQSNQSKQQLQPYYIRFRFSTSDSDSHSLDLPGTHFTSCATTFRPATSYEEVQLATSYPKRRAGRKKCRETRHPVYRGVRRSNSGKWVCEVRESHKKSRIRLDTFPTAEMAARAHDVAALALKGRSPCLNFADSASWLRLPESTDAKDIQRTAAEAAEAFRPPETEGMYCNETSVEENLVTSPDTTTTASAGVLFLMDEEEDSRMPRMLEDMALLSPTHLGGGFHWDDDEFDADMDLWSYSI